MNHSISRFAVTALDQRPFWTQTRKGKAIAATRLLDQRGVAQRLEDTAFGAAHVVINC